MPLHPRTKKALSHLVINLEEHVRIIEPVGYFDMISLEENARLIATDSGGVQREAYYLSIPCLTLREESNGSVQWRVAGTNWLARTGAIVENWFNFIPPVEHPSIYGNGNAQSIADILNALNLGETFEVTIK